LENQPAQSLHPPSIRVGEPHILIQKTMKLLHALTIAALLFQNYFLRAQENDQEGEEIVEMAPFVVSASATPKSIYDLVAPVSVLQNESLSDSLNSTVGETLNGLAGIHATGYSSGASRPIIRGFDGPRIKVMQDSMEVVDVSSTSPDHAVSTESYFAKSIEVLRGPSTLLHGSSAIGGVVNVLDHRTNTEWFDQPVVARVFSEYDTASEGYLAGALATVTQGEWSVTASYLNRDFNDYEISGEAESELYREAEEAEHYGDDYDHDEGDHHDEGHEHHDDEHSEGILENSFVEASTYSASTSWFYDQSSRLSLTWIDFDTQYGIPGHAHDHGDEDHGDEDHDDHGDEDHDEHGDDEHHDDEGHDHEHGEEASVTIDLKRTSVSANWEHALDDGFFQKLSAQALYSDYEHTEFEGDLFGTVYENEGFEVKLSGNYLVDTQHPGVIGYQYQQQDLVAAGEEAFIPASTTDDHSLFVLQEWVQGNMRYEGGIRFENRSIKTDAAADYEDTAMSASFGLNTKLSETISLAVSAQHSERHPSSTELYADGPHFATSQYEIGESDLGVEIAQGIDVTLSVDNELVSGQITGFRTEIDDYIYSNPTGETEDGLPVFLFQAEDAYFQGVEAQFTWHAIHSKDQLLHISTMYDFVDAELSDAGDNLPRVPPQRIGIGAAYELGSLSVNLKAMHAFEQDEVSQDELPTENYSDVDLSLNYGFEISDIDLTISVKVRNLLDEEIRYHTSTTKDVAPEPGRSFIFAISGSWG
jgi:iron complex outermembrane receptor protein